MFGLIFKEVSTMSNPTRDDYDDDKYYYDEETDEIYSRGEYYECYSGDGEKIETDWLIQIKTVFD